MTLSRTAENGRRVCDSDIDKPVILRVRRDEVILWSLGTPLPPRACIHLCSR